MKWFFILLLIGNIAYFGWELDTKASTKTVTTDPMPSIPIGAEQLTLLSELDQQPDFLKFDSEDSPSSPDPAGPSDALAKQMKLDNLDFIQQLSGQRLTDDGSNWCRTYGPIAERGRAEKLVDWMQDKDLQAVVRESNSQEKALFWVYLAPTADIKQAQALIDELAEKGVTDYQMIKRGRFKNAVSLGLFSNKDRVNSRLEEITEKGYKPVVVPYRQGNQQLNYWVDVQIAGSDKAMTAVLAALAEDFDSAAIACDDIALASQNP